MTPPKKKNGIERWPLTESQMLSISAATSQIQALQSEMSRRIQIALRELAEAHSVDPEKCSAKVVQDGDNLALEVTISG